MRDVIGLGAGGHAKVVVETLRLVGEYNVVGLLDTRRDLHGECVSGVPVLAGDEQLSRLYETGVRHAFIGVGASPKNATRRLLYEKALDLGFGMVHAIHPRAFISPSARIGDGLTSLAGSVVHTDAVLGRNVIVNTGAIVEHDCNLGDHVFVASGAVLCGGVRVGRGAYIGAGATVKNGVSIGPGAVVGAGAAVVDDVPADIVVVGVPAGGQKRLVA